ncbi:hypothetical protein [Aquicella lusitana]|uniref:Uncharacterized protein n=1 Tax=Aquicella lusitana TaxID=254246 RepID=A0A370GYD7_9COXI|nr:hypothetical protein [Aquicella lusitana]RDI48662.1 hypothetical protein C8D86_10291 [Aquicella lusitana]VVC73961.1 hypothetical protein AQULUS_17220 [Aquicella lusitana]
MTQPRKLIPKPTMGLGDCAFHAYDRAFWKEPVINQIETNLVKHGKTPGSAFAYFIIIAAKHKFIQLPEDLTNLPLEEAIMKVNEYNFEAKWKEIKEKIFELRKQNEENFQLMLAPIMRELTLF